MDPRFEIYNDTVIFTDGKIGAVLSVKDETWHPIKHLPGKEIAIEIDKSFNGFIKPSSAYKMAKLIF